MKRYKILFSAAAILLLIVSSLGGCTYDPARRYIQTDPNANNMAAPNTPAIPGNVVGRADNSADGNKISATYEVVDFSYITCNTNNLNVRAGAGNKFPSVGTLKSGQKIRALGKLDGWYVVKMPTAAESAVYRLQAQSLTVLPQVPVLQVPGLLLLLPIRVLLPVQAQVQPEQALQAEEQQRDQVP